MKRIESTQNARVKQWKKLVFTRKERDKSQEFIVEGFHLVEEALKNKHMVIALMIHEDVEIPGNWPFEGVEIIQVTASVAKEFAETERSQGIFAHCRQPAYAEDDYSNWQQLLFVDAVQDPGNLGTIIRTADAAGIDAVILGKGTTDCYSPKTVRSGQGAHFNIPIVMGDLTEWVENSTAAGIRVIGTGLTNSVNYNDVEVGSRFALIVGNEGSGVRPELLAKTDANVIIPLYGKAESLNVAVAAGILLYAFVQK